MTAATPSPGKPRPDSTRTDAASPDIGIRQIELLENRLLYIAPSKPWIDALVSLVIAGKIKHRPGSATQQTKEFIRTAEFPPGGHCTLMRHCRRCGDQKWFPPQYISAELCAECIENGRAPKDKPARGPSPMRGPNINGGGPVQAMIYMDHDGAVWSQAVETTIEDSATTLPDGSTSSSPNAAALAALEDRGLVLDESPLLTEDARVLQRQIEKFYRGEKTALGNE